MGAFKTPATAVTVPGRGQPIEAVDVAERICAADGCDRRTHTHGWCGMHAKRVARYGSVDGFAQRPTVEQRFWAKVHRIGLATDLCWLWTGAKSTGGYGMFNPTSRRPVYAHRMSWELLRGSIPANFQIDHLCRVRLCVNPDHLEPVTQQENLRRERAALGLAAS